MRIPSTETNPALGYVLHVWDRHTLFALEHAVWYRRRHIKQLLREQRDGLQTQELQDEHDRLSALLDAISGLCDTRERYAARAVVRERNGVTA